MRIFEVGGCVRDSLLGRKPKDKDYVVVGATPEQMLTQGFKQVGADFPVFLHRCTGEEYALARKERKTSAGYHGFEVSFDPNVTLEDDLRRRDLTVNAMARCVDTGELFDPYNGQDDLKKGIIRHVSDAFAEDPVRVLRVGRFAARYGFSIARETLVLMKQLATSGELLHLTPERVWSELKKAMEEPYPHEFVYSLWTTDAVLPLFPEICGHELCTNELYGAAMNRKLSARQRLAVLFCKVKHENLSSLLKRLKAPSDFTCLALKTNILMAHMPRDNYPNLMPEDKLKMLDIMNAWRDPVTLFEAAEALRYVYDSRYQKVYLEQVLEAYDCASKVTFKSLSQEQQNTLKGKEITKAIMDMRLVNLQSLS